MIKKLFAALALLILLFSINQSEAQVADSAWPMFHHDNQRTGSSQYQGARLKYTRWIFPTGGDITASPVVDTDGTIYIGSYDQYFYAINNFGFLKWRYKTGDIIQSSAAISEDGIIYVGSNDGKLYAFDRLGNVIWTYQTGAAVVSSPAIDTDGTIYFGSSDTSVYALNPDGTLKWKFSDPELGVDTSPALGFDGRVYAGERKFYMYGIDKDTGQWDWQWPTFEWFFEPEDADDDWCFYGGIYASPVIANDGSLYIANDRFNRGNDCAPTENYYFFRVNGWYLGLGEDFHLNNDEYVDVYSTAALRNDDSTFLGYGPNIVHIESNGVLDWFFQTGGKVDSSPALDVSSINYTGSMDGFVYALTGTGNLVWQYETYSSISFSSPAIGPGGTIYVGAKNGWLYAIGGSLCPVELLMQGRDDSLGSLRTFRDRLLSRSFRGQLFIAGYYMLSDEIIYIFNNNPDLQHKALEIAECVLSRLSSLENGLDVTLPESFMLNADTLLDSLDHHGSMFMKYFVKLARYELENKTWLKSLGIVLQ